MPKIIKKSALSQRPNVRNAPDVRNRRAIVKRKSVKIRTLVVNKERIVPEQNKKIYVTARAALILFQSSSCRFYAYELCGLHL